MKTLGIIGGLGPAASAYFYDLLVRSADARRDQEHPEVLLISRPSVPDRTAFILGQSDEDPVAPILQMGRQLISMGAELIALPCVTAHCFYDTLADGLGVPVINMVRETALSLKARGTRTAGLLATGGTLASGIFQRELADLGIKAVIPSPDGQAHIMHVIFDNIKANLPPDMTRFHAASAELRSAGADTIVLACTELSLLGELDGSFVDTLRILAVRSLECCGVPVR